ncbi:MAG: hypothetical protein WAV28_10565 [Sedimentisphaerales bacterium]
MNVSIFSKMAYENKSNRTFGENKPNSNPIKPNLRKAKMNVNSLITKDYRKNDDFAVQQNKPNSNPIKACPERIEFILSVIEGNGPISKKMNVNFCSTGYYESKQKALKKPPLLKVNSEPIIKDCRDV